jgi:phosphoserine phosphatase RsbU/P
VGQERASLPPALAGAHRVGPAGHGGESGMSGARILVVDDEPGMLRTVERVLAPHHDVHTARLPSLALAALDGGPFDLALLDVRMPEMDGFGLMAKLAELRPAMDVILMTGSTDERDERLVRAIRERAFFFLTKPFDREVLLTLVERCLEAQRLEAGNRAHVARIERELEAARVFQTSLLPPPRAERDGVAIALHYEPCSALCGDFCDYVLDEGGAMAMIVCDVSGHGAPAAMLTGMIKQAFHAAAPEQHAPGVILQRIATAIRLFPDGRHLTAQAVRLRPAAGTLEYANAGHLPGLLARVDGTIVRLDSTAPLIHPALPEWPWEQRVVPMAPGDQLVVFTDGLTEAPGADGALLGLERVLEVLRGAARAGTDSLDPIAALRGELARFTHERPLADDLTLAVIRRLRYAAT